MDAPEADSVLAEQGTASKEGSIADAPDLQAVHKSNQANPGLKLGSKPSMASSEGKSVIGGLGGVRRAGTRVPPQVSRPAPRELSATAMEASLKGCAKESSVKRSPINPTQPLPGKTNKFAGNTALTLGAKPAGSSAGLTGGSTRRTVSGAKSPHLNFRRSPSQNPQNPVGPLPMPSSALPLDGAAISGHGPEAVLTSPLAMLTSAQVAGRVLTSLGTREGAIDASEGRGGAPATDGLRDQAGSLSIQLKAGVAENDVTVKDHDSVGMDESESRASGDGVNGESVRQEQPSLRPAEERGGGGLDVREILGRGFAPNPAGSVLGTAGFRVLERKKPGLTVDVTEPIAERDGATLSDRREREGVEDGDARSPILDPKARLERMREYGRQQVRRLTTFADILSVRGRGCGPSKHLQTVLQTFLQLLMQSLIFCLGKVAGFEVAEKGLGGLMGIKSSSTAVVTVLSCPLHHRTPLAKFQERRAKYCLPKG
jgi:hypothetical protein